MSRLMCAQHGRSPNGVQVPCVKIEMNRNEQISTSRGQGGTGDRVAERRLCETRKSMDKNPIQGRPGQVSWHNTAKPFGLARQVNGAIVRGRTAFLPGEVCPVRAEQKSAEVILVGKMSRGRGALLNNDTGGLPPFLSGQASLHFPPPENDVMMAVNRQARSTDEGPNLSGITRPRRGGAARKRQSARDRFSPLRRRA